MISQNESSARRAEQAPRRRTEGRFMSPGYVCSDLGRNPRQPAHPPDEPLRHGITLHFLEQTQPELGGRREPARAPDQREPADRRMKNITPEGQTPHGRG